MEKFYKLLFDPHDGVCFSETEYRTSVLPVERWDYYKGAVYFTLNPLFINKDVERGLQEGRRAEPNVAVYRNFLLEFDKRPISEQRKLMSDSGVPYSTAVYSGGKSVHYIISLTEPIATREEWVSIRDALYRKFPDADSRACRASNFTRCPGIIRPDTQREQQLLELIGRVKKEDLLATLPPPIIPVKVNWHYPDFRRDTRILRIKTARFLEQGLYGEGTGRNDAVYKAAVDILFAGYTQDEAFDMISKATDLPIKEIKTCIKSASRKAKEL